MKSLAIFLGVFTSHVAASGVLRHRQYWPDPSSNDHNNNDIPTPQECIEISFTEPAWGIYDPALTSVNASSGGTQGDIRFLAINSATRVETTCRAQNIELDPTTDIWHNCSSSDLQFQFILSSFQLKLRGTWSCNSSLTFSGYGNWQEPIVQGCLDDWDAPRGQETLCIMGGSHVAASLSQPLPITPQAPYLPFTPTERSWRCVDRSWDPEWQLNNLTYTYTPTKDSYTISLNITNLSPETTTLCSATILTSSLPKNGSYSWIPCNFANGTTALSILPEPEYNILGLHESWSCWDGVEGVEAANYTGIVFFTPPKLSCVDNSCFLASPHNQTGYADGFTPHMPHTSYWKPSCTISSISELSAFTLNSYSLSDNKLNFSLRNPGSGDSYTLTNIPFSTTTADGQWQSCLSGDTTPWQLVGCKYLLEEDTKSIQFEIQWYCDDRDPSNAILFTATTAQTQLLSGSEPMTIPISNLTFKENQGIMDRGPTLPWI
ncbi:hypothetical protein QBC38DRAFT_485585 [Podospora fimiseda]|uniref:AA1-like domain-containing protein n=1 Tax=Podospora fimiseda TaxID=252190 RepID=A0AAN7BJE9_9PEZI|nr:hypothetical protein QBC38DRAFT_485585 [Podospora fimiseda]